MIFLVSWCARLKSIVWSCCRIRTLKYRSYWSSWRAEWACMRECSRDQPWRGKDILILGPIRDSTFRSWRLYTGGLRVWEWVPQSLFHNSLLVSNPKESGRSDTVACVGVIVKISCIATYQALVIRVPDHWDAYRLAWSHCSSLVYGWSRCPNVVILNHLHNFTSSICKHLNSELSLILHLVPQNPKSWPFVISLSQLFLQILYYLTWVPALVLPQFLLCLEIVLKILSMSQSIP